MSAYPLEQLSDSPFVNTIQVLEAVVDRVFRKHHFTSVPTPPPTVRFRVAEEFKKIKELLKAA